MIGGVFQPLSPPSPEQTQQREPLPIGLFAQSVDCEAGDLIGGDTSHDLTQAAKEAGKKTCLAFSALYPVMANSPIIGKNFTNNIKSTSTGQWP